jgi:hypothetical protein
MAITITEVLNQWADYGVFSYVFPFLILFSVVFAILQKSQIFGDPANVKNVAAINAVVAISIGFLALLNDAVSTFFATLFPKFGIALAIFLVLLILVAFGGGDTKKMGWVGWVLGVGILIWAWSQWSYVFDSGFGMTQFLQDYFWGIVLMLGIGALIYWVVKGSK